MRLPCFYINSLLLFVVMVLVGCAPSSAKPDLSVASPADIQAPIKNASDFVLSSGDQLRITVFGDEDLSGEYDIDARGTITMPLIGDVQAASMSVSQIGDYIIAQLSKGFIVDPKVSIEVVSLRPFYILGEVNAPGNYPTVPEMDVFKAIATAGGLTPRAVKNRYIIYRGFAENRLEIEADDQTPVLPGDSIKVKERFF